MACLAEALQVLTFKPFTIDKLPPEFKDGRKVVLYGGKIIGEVWDHFDNLAPVVCNWGNNCWDVTTTCFYSAILENPTHFLPIWQETP